MKKNIPVALLTLPLFTLALMAPLSALAHVTVKPNTVGVGSFQTFNISVPVEKNSATTNIRLELTPGLDYVTPTFKPDWQVSTKRDMYGLKEISWQGIIPANFRDDFTFSAKVPATTTTLVWKAYQTYADGSVVAWELENSDDQPTNASGTPDFSSKGPASKTQVIDDLTKTPTSPTSASNASGWDLRLTLSIVAIIFSLAALVRRR